MGPGHMFGTGWWIIPIIMCVVMMIFMFTMFRRGGFRPPWSQDVDRYRGENKESESALDILKKRYAKGEINKEEFEQMKKDL